MAIITTRSLSTCTQAFKHHMIGYLLMWVSEAKYCFLVSTPYDSGAQMLKKNSIILMLQCDAMHIRLYLCTMEVINLLI